MKTGEIANSENANADRLTVSLGPGQRQVLEQIAGLNGMKLAAVVRYALTQFIKENQGKQIALKFPNEIEG